MGDSPAAVHVVGSAQQLEQVAALAVAGGLAAPHIGPDVVAFFAHALFNHVGLDALEHVGEFFPGPVVFEGGDIIAGGVKDVFTDQQVIVLQAGFLQTGQTIVLTVGLGDGFKVGLHAVLFNESGVVGHVLHIVADRHDAAAGDVGLFIVDLRDDVGGIAGGNRQRNLVGVVGVVHDGQLQVDVGGLFNRLEDAFGLPGILHGVGRVVVEHHGVSDRLFRIEVIAVLIVQIFIRHGRLGGGSTAAFGSGFTGGAAAGCQGEYHTRGKQQG